MQFRLRTLLIVLALGPLVLAGAWIVGEPIVANYLSQPEDQFTHGQSDLDLPFDKDAKPGFAAQ